jgi:2-polyprenyl-6-methoxyphenol hydroxylase-like FAD-dependent oxidoreductase
VETPVLIVGAGPTGLLLAAELRRRGVECTLIDARGEPQRWDRATIVHPRTVELLASLGIAERLLDLGVHQWGIRIFSAGEQLAELDLATSGSRYGFNLNVSEEVTEAVLTDYLGEQGGSVCRGHELVALELGEDSAVATVAHGGDREQIRAAWVVGCGGLHSPVREAAGIPFEGHDIPQPWAVFDVTLAGWAGDLDVNYAFFEQPPVILTPLPGARWRAYLRPSSPDSDLVAEAAAVIGRYDPGAELVEVENPRRFNCHTKVAARYRDGRALLAGDAAHVCTPGQGHGMNTGIQDSFNLAWKLAQVVKGEADEALLDTYEAERRPVAQAITASGDAMEEALMIGDDAAARAERDRSLREAFADPGSNHHEVVAEVELDVEYADSPIVAGGSTPDGDGRGDSRALAAGARLPAELQPRLGAEHTLLVLAREGSPEDGRGIEAELGADGDDLFAATLRVELEAELADRLGVERPTVLAVRPDHYIGLRDDGSDPSRLREYAARIRSGGRR